MIPRSLERDFVGYGSNPPDARWPGKARIALNFVLNYEEGSEYSIMDQDGVSDAALTELPSAAVPRGDRDLAAESMFEYGSRVGFWRLHRIFKERDLPMTIYACALALERNPPAARAIKEAGMTFVATAGAGSSTSGSTKRRSASKSAWLSESLKRTVGQRPLGWYCRYGPTVNTRRLVVEEGGFLYDSDSYADELPYYVIAEGRPHLVVPYTVTNNDLKWGTANLGSGEDFFTILREAFDFLYEEGREAPKMMNVGMHMRLLGHPSRASGLARFLDYVKSKRDVWVCRRLDLAKHWLKEHPCEVA